MEDNRWKQSDLKQNQCGLYHNWQRQCIKNAWVFLSPWAEDSFKTGNTGQWSQQFPVTINFQRVFKMSSQVSSLWISSLFFLPISGSLLVAKIMKEHPRNHVVVLTQTSANEFLSDWLFRSVKLTSLLGGFYCLKIPHRSNVQLLFDLFITPSSTESNSMKRFQQQLWCSELTEWLARLQYLVVITALSIFIILCEETTDIKNSTV